MNRLLQAFFLTAAVLTVSAQTARTPQNETLQAETAADGVKAEKTAGSLSKGEATAEKAAEDDGGTAADSQKSAADLTENVSAEQLLPMLGSDPQTAFEAFGAPVSLTAIPASAGEGFSGSLTAVRIA